MVGLLVELVVLRFEIDVVHRLLAKLVVIGILGLHQMRMVSLLLLLRVLVVIKVSTVQVSLFRLCGQLVVVLHALSVVAFVQKDGIRDWSLALTFERRQIIHLILVPAKFRHGCNCGHVRLRRVTWHLILNL